MEGLNAAERQQVEIELLQAMYPDQVHFMPQRCEMNYSGIGGGTLVLRIPETYPERGLPLLLSATDSNKCDMRTKMTAAWDDMRLLEGEEILDAIVQAFEVVSSIDNKTNEEPSGALQPEKEERGFKYKGKTTIVWLHHLLNTNKRKLALNPTIHADADGRIVSGVTKPGYPGILVFSGPIDLVNAHVSDLKQQRWQAFQIRYEQECDLEEVWKFDQDSAIAEVESMSDVVQHIAREENKEAFLKATGVK